MKYTRKVLFAVLLAASSTIAAEHDNNIIYKDGETLKIQSKIGVEAQLTGDATEFSVVDKDSDTKILEVGKFEPGLNRIKLDGNSASNLVVDIVDSKVGSLEQRVVAVEEAIQPLDNRITRIEDDIEDLLGLKQFAVDYSYFKSITDSRLGFLYNDLGHTVVGNDGLDTNKMDRCFNGHIRSMCLTDAHGGLMGKADGEILAIATGMNPGVEENWSSVVPPQPRLPDRTSKDRQPIGGTKYARDIIYNKIENRFYFLYNGGGIKFAEAADIRTPSKWVMTTFDSGIITDRQITPDIINTYHAAVGADGTMVATTEYGPVWKENGGTVWHKINLPEHEDINAIRCVAAGTSFIKKEEAIRQLMSEKQIEVKQSRDLGLARDSINDYILPTASRFVLGSTDNEGIWYSNPFDVENGWTHVTKTEGGAEGSLATGFRQIAFHNGSYVAPVFVGKNYPDVPTGIFYSTDGINWKLSPGTENVRKMYEPKYALGTFIVSYPWGTKIDGRPVGAMISGNPADGFQIVTGGTGYGVEETEFGAFVYGPYGLYNCQKSARLVSPIIYSKNEIDAMIKNLESKIQAMLPAAGSLQPLQ